MAFPEGISFVKMSADEVHFRTMPKVNRSTRPEIKFVTNLVCSAESKVLANAPGRDSRSLLACLKALTPEQRAEIQFFAVDMHDPFIQLAQESAIKPFKKLALMSRKNRTYIEAYIASGLTTAKSEGLNNKINVLRRSGYGYTNEQSYMDKILQRCGYLNSRFINTSDWFWSLPANLAQTTPF